MCLIALTFTAFSNGHCGASKSSRLSDKPIPYKSVDELPPRTAPLLEIGDPFLGTGNLFPGFTIPGSGAVIQPRLWVFGTFYSAVQTYDQGLGTRTTDWMNRLDLFANLQLSGTERILIGIQPLNINDDYAGYVFEPEDDDGFKNETNLRIRTLFFEGDFGELFPRLDEGDEKGLDFGFSIGRQQIVFQDGILINDTLDAIGITRNSIRLAGIPWISNIRMTGLWGWDEIDRDDNADDPGTHLFGLLTAIDTPPSTVELDAVYVDSDDRSKGDLIVWGIGATQRMGYFNTTIRYLGSAALQDRTIQSDDGHLFFGELSWTPLSTHNLIYANAFGAVDHFRSAARDPITGGPLGRVGLLFSSRNIASFPAPLSNRTDNAYGLALGYQLFFNNNRRQFIVEAGGRQEQSGGLSDGIGVAARFQEALGRRMVLQVDGFLTNHEDQDTGYGLRTELTVKF